MLGAQASGTQVEAYLFALFYQGSRMDIRHPAPFGVPFRVADIMAEPGRFATQITFHRTDGLL